MEIHPSERRTQRSLRPMEALQFFLEAARERLGLHALTLGTAEGWLIAGAGTEIDRVADEGARAARGDEISGDLATWRTRLGDADVVLTSWGTRMSADLADGVRRILAT
jgi:hypothetical protein